MLYWNRPNLLIQTFKSFMVPQKLNIFLEILLKNLRTSTTPELILHFLNEILQISKFKVFASRDKFSRIAQILLKVAQLKNCKTCTTEKFKYWKILSKNRWKIGAPFDTLACQIEKLARLGTLPCQVEKLAQILHVGTLARKNEKLAHWHMGKWASRPRWHAWHAN